ncbi:alpha/beta fold hydrolase [Kribbella sp. NPDC023855]|uniref:alpha/beta fold hydrolase n=1 Tax=Kribbella sp. NPDC023855 TaxID=3154698 RepID=UPI0033EB77A4
MGRLESMGELEPKGRLEPKGELEPEGELERSKWAQLTDEQIRHAMETAFSLPGYRIPDQLVDDVRAMTYHSFTATQQASREYLEQSPLPDRLRPLGLPLLVLFGKNDRRWHSASAHDYQSVPGAQIELLPVLGHSPNLENPPRTAASLLPFTTAVARARR